MIYMIFVEIVADQLPILVLSEEEQSRLLGRVRQWKCLCCIISFVSRSPTMEHICDFAILWCNSFVKNCLPLLRYSRKMFSVVIYRVIYSEYGNGLFSTASVPTRFIHKYSSLFLAFSASLHPRSYRLSGRSYLKRSFSIDSTPPSSSKSVIVSVSRVCMADMVKSSLLRWANFLKTID